VTGVDYYTINPKGNVPCIVLPSGNKLTENIASLLYVADQARNNKVTTLAPASGTEERYLFIDLLSFLGTEVHKSFGPLFHGDEATKPKAKENLAKKLTFLNDHYLGKGQTFLYGSHFTVADSYAYIMLTWTFYVGVSLDAFPNVNKYFNHIKSLDFIQAGHKKLGELSAAKK